MYGFGNKKGALPVWEGSCFFAKMVGVLLQEFEVGDDRRFDRGALTDAEEADEVEDHSDDHPDTHHDPTEEGDDSEDERKRGNDLDLQSLTDVESGVRGSTGREQGDEDTEPSHEVRHHSEHLIRGDVGCVKLCGMVIRVDDGLLELVLDCDERTATFTAILGGIVIAELALCTNFHKHTSD